MISIENIPADLDTNSKVDLLLSEVRQLKKKTTEDLIKSVGNLELQSTILLSSIIELESRFKALEATPKQESNKLSDFLKKYGLWFNGLKY